MLTLGGINDMKSWILDILACPRHYTVLSSHGNTLTCANGCHFPVVNGVPVLLLEEAHQTMDLAHASLRQAREPSMDGGLYVESLGLSDSEKQGILDLASKHSSAVDPVVSFLISATNGIAYKDLIGRLTDYPIPELRIPNARGQMFLDIGCNWGRWCVAASRKGYRVVGIDPSLGAVMAAKRVAQNLGIEVAYVVGDARFLPFKPSTFDYVFSYSVLQHLSREDVATTLSESARVLRDQGSCRIQMPTKFGLRCIYHQFRRRFRDGSGFEVRYWTLPSLRRLFASRIGNTKFSVDCFFGIGLQFSDLRFMTPMLKVVVTASEALRQASRFVTPLTWVADSVYVLTVKDSTAQRHPHR